MFPELKAIKKLPVMIGDAELINARYEHLAGFNRVDARIPDTRHWPTKGQKKLDDAFVKSYLSDPKLFKDGMPLPEFEMTLAFHGLFAIADPSTWNLPREKQRRSLISLCPLPMDYERVDELLDLLEVYMDEHDIPTRVVERTRIHKKKDLTDLVAQSEQEKLEGICVVQHDGTFNHAKSFKIKQYETIDTILLGFFLNDQYDATPENIRGALLGLYDKSMGKYVPALKVNLDPRGVQIKTDGRRDRLVKLRKDLMSSAKLEEEGLVTLYDAYLFQGGVFLETMFDADISTRIPSLLEEVPRGQDIFSLFERYSVHEVDFDLGHKGSKKSHSKADKCIHDYKEVFSALASLDDTPYLKFCRYFRQAKRIRTTSQKLPKPDVIVDTENPVILETHVFDIKWNLNPYPAGFHSWYCDSFKFNNAFAERIRHDKSTTTDYDTVIKVARHNTVR